MENRTHRQRKTPTPTPAVVVAAVALPLAAVVEAPAAEGIVVPAPPCCDGAATAVTA